MSVQLIGQEAPVDPTGLSNIPLHVRPEKVTLEGMLSAALDTQEGYVRAANFNCLIVGYGQDGQIKFARDLGPPEARVPTGVSGKDLADMGVDTWYSVIFALFYFCAGAEIIKPTYSVSAISAQCGREQNLCMGTIGLIRPTGIVPMQMNLLKIDGNQPIFGYSTNDVPF